MRVAVVGVGGLGSHVVQQLAYLGIRQLSIIDDDSIEVSNLNRLVYARANDVSKPKVDVAKRYLETISGEICVNPLERELRKPEVLQEIRETDFVFGCFDHDGPRFILSKMCSILGKPYADLATGIERDRSAFGGRVLNLDPGRGCLNCWPDGLDENEVRDYLDSPEGRRFRADIYGQTPAEQDGSGPAVVSLNGVIASLAVTGFLVQVAGIRPARRYLKYQGTFGVVTQVQTEIWNPAECRICASLAGTGDLDELAGLTRE